MSIEIVSPSRRGGRSPWVAPRFRMLGGNLGVGAALRRLTGVLVVTGTVALAGVEEGDIIWADRFDQASLGPLTQASGNALFAPTAATTSATTYQYGSIVDDGEGGRLLRHTIPAGEQGPFIVAPRLSRETDHAIFEYDLRFDADFDWRWGGKIPGLVGVRPGVGIYTPTSGNPDRNQGFSTRLMWHGNDESGKRPFSSKLPAIPPGSNDMVTYIYARYPVDGFDGFGWHTSLGPLSKGVWHRIKYEVKMNTPGQRDGLFRIWFDGTLKYEATDWDYRSSDDVHIQAILWDVHRGGSNATGWVSPRTCQIDIRNAVVRDAENEPPFAAPAITTQPAAHQAVEVGRAVSFTITATGDALAYQWRKDGLDLSEGGNLTGATSATLALVQAQPTDAGRYTVVVSNAAGAVTSAAAELVVTPPLAAPAITAQPAAYQVVEVGATVNFTVTATGDALAYQWRKDGIDLHDGGNVTGTTSATLTLAQVQLADAGRYTVVVSNTGGAVTSAAAELTVKLPDYRQVYFGTFESGGSWALWVRTDNTGVFLANLPTGGAAKLSTMINPDGSFTAAGETLQASGSGAAVRAAGEHAEAAAFSFTGQIMGVSLTGQTVDGETFSGVADVGAGNAGFYVGSALGTDTGTAYLLVGPSGQAVMAIVTAQGVTGGAGMLTDAKLALTTADGTPITAFLHSANQSFGATAMPASAATPVSFGGVADTVLATSRVVNLSARGAAGAGERTLIVGFVIAGNSPLKTLVRGVGPGLASQGISQENALADPQLILYDSAAGVRLVGNDDWGGTEELRTLFQSVGAFPLSDSSKDAALGMTLTPGLYTAHVTADAATGLALAEVYDVTASGSARLANVSVRDEVKTGDNLLIAGFVVDGNVPMKLLVRGAGPSLVAKGVSADAVLVDPVLTLYRGPTPIAANDNWGGTPALKAAFDMVGAFAFDADDSADAALLVTLEPGIYTVHLAGAHGSSGVGLLEVYALDK